MFSSLLFGLMAARLTFAKAQGNNGQYTPWEPSATEGWGYTTTTTSEVEEITTTTSEYWEVTTTTSEIEIITTTTSNYWEVTTTTPENEIITTTTPDYGWTEYTTITSCYTQPGGLIITITTYVPCPCESITSDEISVGTTTQTLVTTTTPAYSTFTSNNIVYVVPLSTPVTATASAGVEIVNASDASKSTTVEGWLGVFTAFVLGSFLVVAVVL